MTEFQYSAVKALATSPEMFEAFKYNVKNRRQFDQYMNRVWPFSITGKAENNALRINLFNSHKNSKSILTQQLETQLDSARYELFGSHISIVYETSKYSNEFKFIKSGKFKQKSKINKRIPLRVKTAKIEFVQTKDDRCFADNINIYEHTSIQFELYKFINDIEKVRKDFFDLSSMQFYIKIYTHSSDESKKILECLLKSSQEFDKQFNRYRMKVVFENERTKERKESQNVGIEIEYDGCYITLQKKLLKNGAISFQSGVDGNTGAFKTRKSRKYHRLRENRLRINGIYGIKALSILLNDMIERGCSHSSNSSIHYHIDLRKAEEANGNENVSFYGIGSNAIMECLKSVNVDAMKSFMYIYEIPTENYIIAEKKVNSGFISSMVRSINMQDEFKTMEWRMGSKTLIYSKIILQILFAIHLTNAIRYKNKQVNNDYLISLGKIAMDLYDK